MPQIKEALGIGGIASSAYSWYVKGTDSAKGAQIDLLIERADHIISLCEMKFSDDDYSISNTEEENLRRRRHRFIEETGTKESVQSLPPALPQAEGLRDLRVLREKDCPETNLSLLSSFVSVSALTP